MEIKLFRKADIFIIAAALVAAAVLFFIKTCGGEKLEASISVDGKIIETVDLSSLDREITIVPDTEPRVVIKAKNGEIRFESAECPDKLCVSCGRLTKKGDAAVCLPSRTVITLSGADVDAVSY